ncbi:hypothetical protein PQ478_08780 [Alkalihalophilus pseudofirmus]|uniref:hypothetical protein n=1 Tax=Alkalihalophilus pseudofirmus TaxID=79885 RepID=UPI00259B9BE1|nr:hypothetical protein [Alkalihalophilus pseudofirmus]WEG18564.1 hypothetical protein PQ478_08780 [Alkalihalophilus pseudofirmus]
MMMLNIDLEDIINKPNDKGDDLITKEVNGKYVSFFKSKPQLIGMGVTDLQSLESLRQLLR